jgi:proliferating cell nuclear antigen
MSQSESDSHGSDPVVIDPSEFEDGSSSTDSDEQHAEESEVTAPSSDESTPEQESPSPSQSPDDDGGESPTDDPEGGDDTVESGAVDASSGASREDSVDADAAKATAESETAGETQVVEDDSAGSPTGIDDAGDTVGTDESSESEPDVDSGAVAGDEQGAGVADEPPTPDAEPESEEVAADAEQSSDTSDESDIAAVVDCPMGLSDLSADGFPSRWHAETTVDAARTFLQSVEPVVDETRVYLSGDRMTAQATSPEKAALVEATMTLGAFQTFETDGGVFGLSIERFSEVIGMAESKDSTVTFDLDASTRKLTIHIEGVDYTIGLTNPDSIREPPSLGNIKHNAEFAIECGEFNWAIRGAEKVASNVGLGVDPELPAFEMEAEGDTDDVNLRRGPDSLEAINPGDATGYFTIDFVKAALRGVPSKRSPLRIRLGEELPIALGYTFADEDAYALHLVAPRIDE